MSPFFMSRNYDFTVGGLAAVFAVDMALALPGSLTDFNFIIFSWLGMTRAVQTLAHPSARGRMIQHQVALEKAQQKSWLNTRTK